MLRVSRPYYAGDPIYTTTYRYDLLNRVITETNDALNKTSYVDYYRLTTTITNVLGQKRTTLNNSQGQLLSVTDARNNVMRYSYDPFGNLSRTLDPLNNTITLSYDLRGRKTAMNDPDMGVWSYTYNAVSELKTQTDAKLQIASYSYDQLGRIKTRSEADLNTTWNYDTFSTTNKGIGKLSSTTTDKNIIRVRPYI